MASTITDRVNGAVSGVDVISGRGIIGTSNVAGTNDITATAIPTISGYTLNTVYLLRPVNLNNAAVRANIGNGGLIQVVKPNGDQLAAGEFNPALEYMLKFDGTKFVILAPSF